MSRTGASHPVVCSHSLAGRQHSSLLDPTITQHVSGKHAQTVPPALESWAALQARLAALSVLLNSMWSFSPTTRQPEMGIKGSMKEPSHDSKSWGFRRSIKFIRDAPDNLRCVQPVLHEQPQRMMRLKATGVPEPHHIKETFQIPELSVPSKTSRRK